MKSVLGRFRKRNIQTNFYQFMLVVFVVAVSVCLIAGLFINFITLKSAVNNYFKNSNLPNLWVRANQISSEDENFYSSRFEFDKRFMFESSYRTGSSDYEGIFYVSDAKVSIPYIVEGDREDGCYVDIKFAKEHGFGLNHSTINFDFELGGQTKSLRFKIVGFISMAEDLLVDGDSVIFIDEEFFLESLKNNFDGISDDFSDINYNEILISSEISQKDVEDIEKYYEGSSSELLSLTTKQELESFKKINAEIETAKNMLWIFPIIFVVISLLVVYSAISQLVLKERYNIGLLKSLGKSNRQIVSNYCGYGTTICFIGAVLGLLASPLIIPNMTFEVYDKLYNLPRAEVKLLCPALLIVCVIFVAVLIGYVSALFVVLSLTRKTPKECMSKFSKAGLASRKKKRKLPANLSAVFRNMKLNISRTIMSVVGVAGSSLLVLLGFGVNKIMQKNAEKNGFAEMEVFSRIFKGFSFVLLSLTIIILLVQIFKERLKEMAVLRIHGESYIKIWLSVLLEMLFVGVIGFLISAIFSTPAMLLNLNIFGIDGFFAIDFLAYLKTFLLVFLLIVLTASFGIIKIYRLRLDEAVKFSE